MIILPRQARDKHRETHSKKGCVVFFTNSGGVYDCSVDTPQTEEFTRMQVREKHLAPGGAA
jgi:hypothetical protein